MEMLGKEKKKGMRKENWRRAREEVGRPWSGGGKEEGKGRRSPLPLPRSPPPSALPLGGCAVLPPPSSLAPSLHPRQSPHAEPLPSWSGGEGRLDPLLCPPPSCPLGERGGGGSATGSGGEGGKAKGGDGERLPWRCGAGGGDAGMAGPGMDGEQDAPAQDLAGGHLLALLCPSPWLGPSQPHPVLPCPSPKFGVISFYYSQIFFPQ